MLSGWAGNVLARLKKFLFIFILFFRRKSVCFFPDCKIRYAETSEKGETDYSHGGLCINSAPNMERHVLLSTAEMSVGSSKSPTLTFTTRLQSR